MQKTAAKPLKTLYTGVVFALTSYLLIISIYLLHDFNYHDN